MSWRQKITKGLLIDSPLWIFKAWCLSTVHPPSLEAMVSYPWRTAVLFSHRIKSGHDSYSNPTDTRIRRRYALVIWIKEAQLRFRWKM